MKAAQLLRQLRVPMIKFPARMNADGSRKCYFKPATSQPSCIPPCVEDGAAFLWVFCLPAQEAKKYYCYLDKVLLPSSTYKIYTPTQRKYEFNSTVPQLESKADERSFDAALSKKCF